MNIPENNSLTVDLIAIKNIRISEDIVGGTTYMEASEWAHFTGLTKPQPALLSTVIYYWSGRFCPELVAGIKRNMQ